MLRGTAGINGLIFVFLHRTFEPYRGISFYFLAAKKNLSLAFRKKWNSGISILTAEPASLSPEPASLMNQSIRINLNGASADCLVVAALVLTRQDVDLTGVNLCCAARKEVEPNFEINHL